MFDPSSEDLSMSKMSIIRLLSGLAASLGLAACHDMEPSDVASAEDKVLHARIEQSEATRTCLNDAGNVLWSENDRIVAFMKTPDGQAYHVDPTSAGKNYADFIRSSSAESDELSDEAEWEHNVAYYPYDEAIGCVRSGEDYRLDVVLPAEQEHVCGSFGNQTWPMVAVSETAGLTFMNVCGGMMLQLKGTQKVCSITLQGKNRERLSGAAAVTAYADGSKPVISMAEEASETITLDCADGVQLSQAKYTEFIIALPPAEFSKGFTATVTDDQGQTYVLETDKVNTVRRSDILIMPAVDLDVHNYPGCPYINNAVFFGDSIIHGVYSYYEESADGKTLRKNGFDSNSDTYPRIPDYFGLYADASVTNNGKRGSGWITDTRNLGNALEMASQTDFSEYDFAAFCLGINDWIQGAQIGSLEEPGNTGGSISEGTVVANMIACFEKVAEDNPQCRIVVYSPYVSWGQRSDGGDYTANTLYGNESTDYALGAANKAGYTLQDLIDVIDQVCCHYGIRHVPLSKSEVCTLDNVKDIMIDGLHPSREARPALALEILEQAGY